MRGDGEKVRLREGHPFKVKKLGFAEGLNVGYEIEGR